MRRKLSSLVLGVILALTVTVHGSGSNSGNPVADSIENNVSTKPSVQSQYTVFDFEKYGGEFTRASNPSKSPEIAKSGKDVICVGVPEFDGIFNYIYSWNEYDWYACYTMFDFNIDIGFDGKTTPGATDYTVSRDGLTYTFKIKDGVKFWDGKPATAKDLEFAYYLIADPDYDGHLELKDAYIKGLNEYRYGQAKTIEGIKVIDDKTLQITCEKLNAAALLSLRIPLIEKSYYSPDFKKGDTAVVKEKNGVPMGTGQYKFVGYKPGQELYMVANENYFKGAPGIKNLRFIVTPDDYQLHSILTGRVDISITDASVDNMNTAQEAGYIDIIKNPIKGYGYIGLNDANEKFKDTRVRQALMYALDRKTVVKKVFGINANVINIPELIASWAYNDDGVNNYDFNLRKAAHLLDEAGWKLNKNGRREKNGKPFTIKFSCITPHFITDIMIPIIKENYAKLGIDVTVETLDWPTLYEMVAHKRLEAYFMASAFTPDPDDQAEVFKTGGSMNFFNYSNPTVDKLYDYGASKLTFEERKPIYKEIYKILNEELPMLYIYQRSDMWAVNSRIKGIETSSFREPFFNLYKCEIDK